MSGSTLACILVSVSMSALAQIAFKFGVSSAQASAAPGSGPAMALMHALLTPGVLGGLALYGLGTLVWLTALSRVDVSQAYPFVGLGFVLTAALGTLVFGETMAPMRLAGMLLVMAGIVVLARA